MTVCTLIGHRDLETGLVCLGSMVEHSVEGIDFRIHDDGTLTTSDREQLLSKLPVSSFVDRSVSDGRMRELLSRHPASAKYRENSVYGLKLFDVPLHEDNSDIAFCDSDIKFFRAFRDLFLWPDSNTGCLFMRDWQEAYSLHPWNLRVTTAMPERLNSGLFLFRRHLYDLEFIEWFLSRRYRAFRQYPWWKEQTAWAALAWRSRGRFWSDVQIRTIESVKSIDENLIAGHFTSTVRGLLSTFRTQREVAPEKVQTVPMPRLNPAKLLLQQGGRFVSRARAFGITLGTTAASVF
jgi:hypothetical protein